MCQHDSGLEPSEPELFERERAKKRRRDAEGVNGRADIVDKTREGQLSGTGTAAGDGLGLEHHNLAARLSQNDGGGQTVRSRTNDCCLERAHKVSMRVASLGPKRFMPDALSGYALSRLIFERSLALNYLIAFVCAANQFVPLLGEHGLLPVSRFVRQVPFQATPSLFYLAPTDRAFRIAAWLGIAVSAGLLAGVLQRT